MYLPLRLGMRNQLMPSGFALRVTETSELISISKFCVVKAVFDVIKTDCAKTNIDF